jgi:hypothetical protein
MKRRKRKLPPSLRGNRLPFFRVAHFESRFDSPLELAHYLCERTWASGDVELTDISFFLWLDDNTVCLLTPERASKNQIDRAIRALVTTGMPVGRITKKVIAVVAVAEAWANADELERRNSLEGLPGTFEIAMVILDSPTSQRIWSAQIEGERPHRLPGEWEESNKFTSYRFGNYFPQGRN